MHLEAKVVSLSSVAQGYLAVAAVRKEDTGFTWSTVRGKKSCHTAVDRTAGWNIPMGLLVNQTNSCQFSKHMDGVVSWDGHPGSGSECLGTLGKGGIGDLLTGCSL